ncbi:MAG TPA: class I SAM-dependent methyltransferase [Ohtaekwangia sp.]|nr:class I SAM-dependent methyltransferase [Ohtaekwangia sp.]
MKSERRYTFFSVGECNMCKSPVANHKILGKRLNQSQGFKPQTKGGITTSIYKCDQCDLIYSNPQPRPVNLQDHYGVPPESYWKEEYFNVTADYFKSEINAALRLLENRPSLKSLDIGAGIGKCMVALSNAGFDSYGFEPSQPFYEKAIGRMGIDNGKLKLASIETAEYPADYFDFITFGAVLEHLYDPSSAIVKALRWLKKDGIIHIEVPSSNWLINKLINFSYSARLMDYVGNLSPMHEPFHLYEFGLKSFLHHAEQHQYRVADHTFYVCDTFLPGALDFVIKPYMRMTKQGMQLCVWLRK